MPGLSFTQPLGLLLLLIIPLLWLCTRALPQRSGQGLRTLTLTLRSITLAALVLALAGTQLNLPVNEVNTIFLIDNSYSIGPAERQRATAFVGQALAAMPANARAAIVSFGGRAEVARVLSDIRTLPVLQATGDGTETNIADAVQLGLALLPREGYRRLVLLSDGGETQGDLRTLVPMLRRQGIPLDILPLNGVAEGLDAEIRSLSLPQLTREGQQPRLVIQVASSAPAIGQLQVKADGVVVVEQQAMLPGGEETIELTLPTPTPGFHRYQVRLEIADDTRPANNIAEGFSTVAGPPRVLLIEGRRGVADPLRSALVAARIDAETTPPARAPQSLSALGAYDAVLLVNVPLRALPLETVAALPAYVREMGRGLAMIGGDQSFGAGGYRASPLEELLPVKMDIMSLEQQPAASIAVVIDTSGSMAQTEKGVTKLQLAAEGVVRIAEMLRDSDELTIIPFDTMPTGIIGPLPGSQRQQAIDSVLETQIGTNGGGILVRSSLEQAMRFMQQTDRPLRHIILLSDGDDAEEHEGVPELVRELTADKITLSVVAIGSGQDEQFLERSAAQGRGRYFLARQAGTLPAILTQDAQHVLRPYLVEGRFAPVQSAQHPMLRDINIVAPLRGYVATTARQAAQMLLTTPQREPLLAVWQTGLGRSLAWTSDLSGRWAADWVQEPNFPRFAAQLVGWLLPSTPGQQLSLQASVTRGTVVLALSTTRPDDQPWVGLKPGAKLHTGAGAVRNVVLAEAAPGIYRAEAPGLEPGAYEVQVEVADSQGRPVGAVSGGVVVPSAAEYRQSPAGRRLLEEVSRLTGGRSEPPAEALFAAAGQSLSRAHEIGRALLWLALLLLLLEVAARRAPPGLAVELGVRLYTQLARCLNIRRAAPSDEG